MENNFIPVSSTMIKEVQYNQGDNTLLVKFHNNSIYKYSGVVDSLYDALLSADSVGKFFVVNIKKLPCIRME